MYLSPICFQICPVTGPKGTLPIATRPDALTYLNDTLTIIPIIAPIMFFFRHLQFAIIIYVTAKCPCLAQTCF